MLHNDRMNVREHGDKMIKVVQGSQPAKVAPLLWPSRRKVPATQDAHVRLVWLLAFTDVKQHTGLQNILKHEWNPN